LLSDKRVQREILPKDKRLGTVASRETGPQTIITTGMTKTKIERVMGVKAEAKPTSAEKDLICCLRHKDTYLQPKIHIT
jgi:hypothetical protein